MEPIQRPDPVCFKCQKPFLNEPSAELLLLPCAHRIHISCLNILRKCPECTNEISGVVKANLGFPTALKMMSAITASFSSAYLHVGYAYFEIVETLIRNSNPKDKSTYIRICGHQPIPVGANMNDGFMKLRQHWVEFLLEETFKKLKLSTQIPGDGKTNSEFLYDADVCIVVLTPEMQKMLMFPEPDTALGRPYNSYISEGFFNRLLNAKKAFSTYVINLTEKPCPDISIGRPKIKQHHVTDVKTLYEAHLKIVADFLKFNPEVLNSALANFENKWKKIMGGNLS